jgi:hypothetical protein
MADGRIEVQDIFAPDVEKAIQDVTAELKKLTDQLTAAAKASSGYKASTEDVAQSQEELQKQEVQAAKIRNELIKAENQYIKLQQEKIKLDEKQAKLDKQANADDEKELGTIEKLVKQNKELNEQKKKLNLETEAGRKKLKEYNDQLNKNDAALKSYGSNEQQRIKGIGLYKDAIGSFIKVFAGIGIAVTAGKQVIDFFAKSSEEVGDRIKFATAGMGAAFGVLKGDVSEALINIDDDLQTADQTTGHWYSTVLSVVGGLLNVSKWGEGFGENIRENKKDMDAAANAAIKYAKALDELEELEIKQIIPRAESNLQLKKARELMYEEGLSLDEKKKRVAEVFELEEKIADEEIKNQQFKTAAIKQAIIAAVVSKQETKALSRELAQSIAKEKELLEDSTGRKLKLRKQLAALEKESAKETTNAEKQALEDSIKFYTAKVKEQGENIAAAYLDREALIEKQYELEIMNANGAAGAIALANQNKIDSYKKLNDELTAYNTAETNAIDLVTEVHAEAIETQTKNETQSLETREERYKKYFKEITERTTELANLGADFLENQRIEEEQLLENRLNAIDAETEKRLEANGLQEASKVMQLQSELAELQAAKAGETDATKAAELQQSIVAKEQELARTKIVEDAEKRKETVKKETAKKIAEIERKQAMLTKTAAMIDIAIKTAQAIMTVTAQTGIFAIVAGAAVAALSAAQLVAVAAQPLPEIPQYKKGTKDHKGGAAIVHGQELVELPTGQSFITKGGIDEGLLMGLPEHTKVTPADITNKILKEQVMMLNLEQKNSKESLLLQSIDKRLKGLKQVNVNIDKYGFRVAAKEGANITKYMNTKFRC